MKKRDSDYVCGACQRGEHHNCWVKYCACRDKRNHGAPKRGGR